MVQSLSPQDFFNPPKAGGLSPEDFFGSPPVTISAPKGVFNSFPTGQMQNQSDISIGGQTPDMNQAINSFPQQVSVPSGFDKYNALERGMGNAALGFTQLANTGNQNIDQNLLAQTIQNSNEAGKGTGIGGLVGEAVGDPKNYMLGLIPGSAMTSPLVRAGAGAAYGLMQGSESPDMVGQLKEKAINAGGNALFAAGAPIAIEKATPIISDIAKTMKLNYDVSPLASDVGGAFGSNLASTVSTPQMKQMSKYAYDQAESQGGTLHPEAVNKLVDKINSVSDLTDTAKNFAGETLTGKTIASFENLKNKPLSLADIDGIDKVLSNKIESETDFTGKVSPEGRQLSQIQDKLRSATEDAPKTDLTNPEAFDSWKQGRDLYAASMRSRELDKIFQKANSSETPQTAIKAGFKRLADKIDENGYLRGYTPEETKAIQKAAKTGIVTGALKIAGSRIISGVAGAVGGGTAGGVPGAILGTAAAEGAAYPVRQLAGAMQAAKGLKAQQLISNRPAVQEMLTNAGYQEFLNQLKQGKK